MRFGRELLAKSFPAVIRICESAKGIHGSVFRKSINRRDSNFDILSEEIHELFLQAIQLFQFCLAWFQVQLYDRNIIIALVYSKNDDRRAQEDYPTKHYLFAP